MIRRRPNAVLKSLALLMLLAVTILAPLPAPAAEVIRQIPYSQATKLALSTAQRLFRFSLLDESGATLWSEEKAYQLATSRVVTHMLGSVTPFPKDLFPMFSQQLWVRLEYRTTRGWQALATTSLQVAPYALWSVTSENAGPAGLACWDLNGNGDCDQAEDVAAPTGCDALDCRGPEGPQGPADGLSCWDLNGNRTCDPAEDVAAPTGCDALDCKGAEGLQGLQGLKGDKGDAGTQGAQGIQGPKGDKGDTGQQGIQGIQGLKGDKGDTGSQGPQGLNCWDLNRSGTCNKTPPYPPTGNEDRNGDNDCTPADCAQTCWDLNKNNVCDLATEDKNGDGLCDVLDCVGVPGPQGLTGPPGDLFVESCPQNGQTLVWNATLGAWECGAGPTVCTDYYYDADGDGAGFGSASCLSAPSPGTKYTATQGGDVDDDNCLTNPDMVWFLNSRGTINPEWCTNGKDEGLNGTLDTSCTIFFQSYSAANSTVTGWFDRDGDGYFTLDKEVLPVWFGSCLAAAPLTPATPPTCVPLVDCDCDNVDSSVHPGAEDLCDGIDQDCDGVDGHNDVQDLCDAIDQDCDGTDGHWEVAPICDGIDQNCDGTDGVREICSNYLDDDCDGLTDENPCSVP